MEEVLEISREDDAPKRTVRRQGICSPKNQITARVLFYVIKTNKINIINWLVQNGRLHQVRAHTLLRLLDADSANALFGFKSSDLRRLGFRQYHITGIGMLMRPRGESVNDIIERVKATDPTLIDAIKFVSERWYSVTINSFIASLPLIGIGYDDVQRAIDWILINTTFNDELRKRSKQQETSTQPGGDPPNNPFDLKKYFAIVLCIYGKFKAIRVEKIEINDYCIFFNGTPNTYEVLSYHSYDPVILLTCLYSVHYALRSGWDTYRDVDLRKSELLKSKILAMEPAFQGVLEKLTEQLNAITPDVVNGGMDEYALKHVDMKAPPGFHVAFEKKSSLIAPMITDVDLQYKFQKALEDDIFPNIYEDTIWTWSMVRSAMVKVGMFVGVNGTERGKNVMKDGSFANAVLPFISEKKRSQYDITYDTIRTRAMRSGECDKYRDSADYIEVKKIAKILREYGLGKF